MKWRGGTVSALVALSLSLAACSSAATSGTSGKAATAKQHKGSGNITFATDFGLYGRQSLFFTAQKEGYYRAKGLNVTFEAGNGSGSTAEEVATGKAQLGFADLGTLAVALGKAPLPVKTVAAIYQNTAITLFGLKGPGLTKPADLAGKTAACSAGDATQALWPVYAKSVGVNPSALSVIHVAPSAFPQLLASGKVQLVCEFSVGRALLEKAVHNRPLIAFSYAPLGLYGNGIIVNTNFLASHPGAVRNFVAASLEGARYAFSHPTAAGEATKEVNPGTDVAEAAAETSAVAQLAETPVTRQKGLGYISASRLKKTISVIQESYPHGRTLTPKDMYAPGYLP